MKSCLFLFFVLIFNFSSLWASRNDIHWRELNSEHFSLIHDARQKEIALQYIDAAEVSYSVLKEEYPDLPKHITIVLSDFGDLANGSATVFPYPVINIYASLPDIYDSIYEYGNWPYELSLHELSHILTMAPQRGLVNFISYIFGSIIRPNILLPRWYHEGQAVEVESRLSSNGRLRSNYFNGFSRILTKYKKWDKFPFTDINETAIPTWPLGSRPYYFGGLFFDYLHSLDNSLNKKLIDSYSGRLPYMINGPVEDLRSKDFSELYNDAIEFHKAESNISLAKLNSDKRKKLKTNGIIQKDFVHSTKHGIAFYLSKDINADYSIISFPSNEVLFSSTQFRGLDIHPTEKLLITASSHSIERSYNYFDLYEYNFESKKGNYISTKERVNSPSYSLDGNSIFYVANIAAEQSLRQYNRSTKEIKTIIQYPYGIAIQSPIQWSANEVLYIKNQYGSKQIIKRNLESNKESIILPFIDKVSFIKKEDNGLLLVSGHTGINQAYFASSNLKEIKLLSKSIGHIFSVSKMDKDLISSELHHNGIKLYKREWKPTKAIEKQLDSNYNKRVKSYAPPKANYSVIEEDYSSWSYLLPRYWLPYVYPLANGVLLQASTSSADPLAKNLYALSLSFDSRNSKTSYSLFYQNNSFDVSPYFSVANSFTYLDGDGSTLNNKGYVLGLSSFIYGLNNDWSMSWFLSSYEDQISTDSATRNGVGVSIGYSTIGSIKGYKISPETGWSFKLERTEYFDLEKADNELSYAMNHFRINKYFSSFLPKRHSLFTQLKLSQSPTDRNVRIGTVSGGHALGLLGSINDSAIYGSQIFSSSTGNSFHNIRGYPYGEFLAWSMASLNLEYQMPLSYIFSGSKLPIHYRKLFLSFTIDALGLDGAYFDKNNTALTRDEWDTVYASAGMEAHLTTNVGYYIPMDFYVGLYYANEEKAYGGPAIGIGIGISGF